MKENYTDVHYTNQYVAKLIVDTFSPSGRVLEPARGGGSFYQFLPPGSDWCEIEKGRDFFKCSERYDWIVTNPPFSCLTEWMAHSFKLSSNVVLLVPIAKVFASGVRMDLIRNYGGIKKAIFFNRGRHIGFNVGFPFGAFHFSEGWRGGFDVLWYEEYRAKYDKESGKQSTNTGSTQARN